MWHRGFYGYITSDCGAGGTASCLTAWPYLTVCMQCAVEGVQNGHHYTNSTAQTFNATFGAGMDMDCGHFADHDDVVKVGINVLHSQASTDTFDYRPFPVARPQWR